MQSVNSDIELTALINPVAQDWVEGYGSTQALTYKIKNLGLIDVLIGELEITFSTIGPNASGPITELINTGIPAGDSLDFATVNTVNMLDSGEYVVSASIGYTAASGKSDPSLTNNNRADTLISGLRSLPFYENFNSWTSSPSQNQNGWYFERDFDSYNVWSINAGVLRPSWNACCGCYSTANTPSFRVPSSGAIGFTFRHRVAFGHSNQTFNSFINIRYDQSNNMGNGVSLTTLAPWETYIVRQFSSPERNHIVLGKNSTFFWDFPHIFTCGYAHGIQFDNFHIYDNTYEAGIEDIQPTFGCDKAKSGPISVVLKSFGAYDIPGDQIIVNYQVSGAMSTGVISESLSSSDTLSTSLIHQFTIPLTAAASGNINIKAWLSLSPSFSGIDYLTLNDTLEKSFGFASFPSSVPYNQSFNSNPYSAGWRATDSIQWSRGATSPNPLNGPAQSCLGTGNFMLSNSISTQSQDFGIESPCIDLSNSICPKVEFCYFMYGNGVESLHLDAQIDDQPWILDIAPPIIGQQQNSPNEVWNTYSANLSEFIAAGTIRLRIRARNGNWGPRGSIAIDDFNIYENLNTVDISIRGIEVPIDRCAYQINQPISVTIYNNGCDTIPANSIQLSYLCTAVQTGILGTDVIPKSLVPGEEYRNTFTSIHDFSSLIDFDVEVEAKLLTSSMLVDMDTTNNNLEFNSIASTFSIMEIPIIHKFSHYWECGIGGWVDLDGSLGCFGASAYGNSGSQQPHDLARDRSPCISATAASDPVVYLKYEINASLSGFARYEARIEDKLVSQGGFVDYSYWPSKTEHRLLEVDSFVNRQNDFFSLWLESEADTWDDFDFANAWTSIVAIVERDSLIFVQDTLFFNSSTTNPLPKLQANILEGDTYAWNTGASTDTLVILSPGWYHLSIYDDSTGLLHSDTIFVVIDGHTRFNPIAVADYKIGDGSTSGPTLPKKAPKTGLEADSEPILGNLESYISLRPNPAGDYVIIETVGDVSINRVLINDMNGKQLAERFGSGRVDLKSLSSGVYIFQIHTSSGIVHKRLLKR